MIFMVGVGLEMMYTMIIDKSKQLLEGKFPQGSVTLELRLSEDVMEKLKKSNENDMKFTINFYDDDIITKEEHCSKLDFYKHCIFWLDFNRTEKLGIRDGEDKCR